MLLIALGVILALLLFFCNQKLNKDTEVDTTDSISVAATDTLKRVETTDLKMEVVPGEKAGAITIGQSAESLRTLGPPTTQDSAMGKSWATWVAKDGTELDIFTTYKDDTMKEKVVKLIRATSPDFRTNEGTGPGQTADSIKAKHPSLKRVATYKNSKGYPIQVWDDKAAGVAFETDVNRCVGVIVHEKGADVATYYITFRPEMKVM